MRRAALLVVAALGLVVVAQAGAHAEIKPESVPAGGVSTFTLSVECEKNAPTVKVAMRLPSGMANLKPAEVAGWQVNLGGRVITWTGGRVAQGKTGEFEITAQSSSEPAPTIRLTAAVTPPPPAPEPPAATTPTTATTVAGQDDDGDDGSAGWIIGAAIVVGLIAAGAALLWRRRG